MSEIRLTDVSVDNNRSLTIDIQCENIPSFFKYETFTAEYDRPVDSAPESVLAIPALATVCPVAWAYGANVYVDEIDDTFFSALGDLKSVYRDMYPSITWDGTVIADRSVSTSISTINENSICLFTGGVDSLATYFRHIEENPILVSILGGDVSIYEQDKWNRILDVLTTWTAVHDSELINVESNFEDILDTTLLHSYFRKDIGGAWWARVQHGPALLGMLAPLSYELGANQIYIAATHSEGHVMPWGSHPKLDTEVRWDDTSVHHDAFELTRQEKIEFISKQISRRNDHREIISCHHLPDGKNCSQCEKCSRTLVGLELGGLNPEHFGYDIDDYTFERIKRKLEKHEWDFGDDEEFMWQDLKSNVPDTLDCPHDGAESFAGWLRRQDVSSFKSELSVWPTDSVKHKFVPFIKYIPQPIYSALYTLFN